MKIILTGGAGFIGSHLADAYIKEGYTVAIIDNLATGRLDFVNPKAKFYKADICDYQTIAEIISREKPDIINHHAALGTVVSCEKDERAAAAINIEATKNLLEIAGKNGIKKFIFASSGGVIYGNVQTLPISEQTPARPISAYGRSKLQAEQEIINAAAKHNFAYLIMRYGNVYGPRQNPHGEAGAVAIFTKAMLLNQAPTLFGRGTMTRDYVYIDDITKANLAALACGHNEIINLGTGQQTSGQQMFEMIAQILNFKKGPAYAPIRPGEIERVALDSEKAKTALNWRAKTALADGLIETVQGIRA